MNQNRKHYNYLITAILIITSILMIFCVLSPFLLPLFYNWLCLFGHDGYAVPTRVVGVSYPISSLLPLSISFALCILLVFSLAKRKKASSVMFWINGIAISITVSTVMWLFLIFFIPGC